MPMSIYNFQIKTMDQKFIDLTAYKDQVLLIVNVASQCGFTKQYEGLESLFQTYKVRGFSVLGFPCNQFGSQEPGSEAEIKKFCEIKYNITFPLFAKIFVNGPKTEPLYSYLKANKTGFLGIPAVKWNFTKFLIDRKGNVLKRYAPQTDPMAIAQDIEKLL